MTNCYVCKTTLKVVFYYGDNGLYCSAPCFEKGEKYVTSEKQLELFSDDECQCSRCKQKEKRT